VTVIFGELSDDPPDTATEAVVPHPPLRTKSPVTGVSAACVVIMYLDIEVDLKAGLVAKPRGPAAMTFLNALPPGAIAIVETVVPSLASM
jgi:hypothetical protein